MRSPALIYALIEFAKEKHKTQDLSTLARGSVFISQIFLKRTYGVTFDELKQYYKYEAPYIISGADIEKATNTGISVEQSDKAAKVINSLLQENEKSV